MRIEKSSSRAKFQSFTPGMHQKPFAPTTNGGTSKSMNEFTRDQYTVDFMKKNREILNRSVNKRDPNKILEFVDLTKKKVDETIKKDDYEAQFH